MQFELALNAGPSHPVKLDVPTHPKQKSIKDKITIAVNIFNRLLIAQHLRAYTKDTHAGTGFPFHKFNHQIPGFNIKRE